MSSVKNSTVVIGSPVGRDVVTNVHVKKHVSNDYWIQLTTLAAAYGKNNELRELREVENSLNNGDRQGASQRWSRIRGFFESMLPHAANIAQIIGTVDELIRAGR